MSIPFTQHLRPRGRLRVITIDMSDDIKADAQNLIDAGYHFEIEVLTTGMVSMTCEKGDELFAIRLCTNGPDTEQIVELLVRDAISKAFGE